MSVRKRTLPSGEIRWVCDYRDQEGKRRARQFPTQRAAVSCETRIRSEIVAGTHVPDSASATLEQAGQLWLQRCRLDRLEAGTLRNYRQHLNLHILPLLGGSTRLAKLTRPAVEIFRDRLVETRSRTLANKVLISLKSLLSDAQRRGLVVQNAATGTRVKTASRHEKKNTSPHEG